MDGDGAGDADIDLELVVEVAVEEAIALLDDEVLDLEAEGWVFTTIFFGGVPPLLSG